MRGLITPPRVALPQAQRAATRGGRGAAMAATPAVSPTTAAPPASRASARAAMAAPPPTPLTPPTCSASFAASNGIRNLPVQFDLLYVR